MRFNIRTGTFAAFTFLALVCISQALVFWLPVWKETTVFRYHPKKGWHAIKHGGSSLWKPKQPLRLPPLIHRHRHSHPHNHHHHHRPPLPFFGNPFRHFHPHRHFHLRRPHLKSPVHVLQKFKHWRPIRAHPHPHPHPHPRIPLLHKPLCPSCHLSSWKPRKPLYNNGFDHAPFNQPPFSSIHHDFPKFGPFMLHNPTHVIPKMAPIFTKLPKVKSVLRIKKVKKHPINSPHGPYFKTSEFHENDPFGKINAFQKTSPYPVRSNFPKTNPFPKNYIPKTVPFPKHNPYSPSHSHYPKYSHYPHKGSHYSKPSPYPPSKSSQSPRINPYLSSAGYSSKPKSNANPFAEIENSPPLFSSQFSLGDNNFNKDYPFSQVAHFPKGNHHHHHHHQQQFNHHPQDAPGFPKEFGTFGKDMALSGFAMGQKGGGWGGWDW